jgi:hypothetical protein
MEYFLEYVYVKSRELIKNKSGKGTQDTPCRFSTQTNVKQTKK